MDLGLPSGTLWLDRLVGAPSPSAAGLFYQWGAIEGHSETDGYNFNADSYEAQGLNLITSALDDTHDAARAYYGPVAKMPTTAQYQELIENCVISSREDGMKIITSNINGNSLAIRANGLFNSLSHRDLNELRSWVSTYGTEQYAPAFHTEAASMSVTGNSRFLGLNIMAVHS